MTRKPDPNETNLLAPVLDQKIDAMIGAKLRGYYDSLLAEPVPDRIIELLQQLDAQEQDKKPGSR